VPGVLYFLRLRKVTREGVSDGRQVVSRLVE
jgi:hypothetical protein